MTQRYTELMVLVVDRATRIELSAIAYHMGQKGLYSRAAKLFLRQGIDKYLGDLTPKQRLAYDEIMTNVQMLADEGGIRGIQSFAEYQKKMNKRAHKPRE